MTKGMENTMADTKLFNIKGAVKEYQSGTVTLEKELQTVIGACRELYALRVTSQNMMSLQSNR